MNKNNLQLLLLTTLIVMLSGCVAQAQKGLLKNHTAMITHNKLEVNIISLNGERYPRETKGHMGDHTEVQPGLQKIEVQLVWTSAGNTFGPHYRIISPIIKQACFVAREGNILQVGAELLPYNSFKQEIPDWNLEISRLDSSAKQILTRENIIPIIRCPN